MKGRVRIENRARGSKPQCLSHSNFKTPRISNAEKDIILKPSKTNYTLMSQITKCLIHHHHHDVV